MPEVNVDGSIRFVAQGVTLEDYACTAIAVLVFYDYFLTLDLEVQNIWTKKFRGPTLIFFLNRYLCIGLALALLLPTETQLEYVIAIFGSALGIVLALFFALRTYAISNCKLSVFLIVFMAYIPGFAMNLVSVSFLHNASEGYPSDPGNREYALPRLLQILKY
ncbi:hypothetical protein BC629DRAFT_1593291 [Irpex lacteus]|nr:hypothetical protein BC629DRAFT_1593291 [Irpex lacteus]